MFSKQIYSRFFLLRKNYDSRLKKKKKKNTLHTLARVMTQKAKILRDPKLFGYKNGFTGEQKMPPFSNHLLSACWLTDLVAIYFQQDIFTYPVRKKFTFSLKREKMSFSDYHIEKEELKKFRPFLFGSETIKVKEDREFRSHW